METRNFNLDAAIKTHVQNLQNKGSITAGDAAELSSHLYDSTEALIKQQLTVEEAFMVSAKRLGADDVLHHEYSKVNTSLNVNRIWAYMMLGFNLLFAMPGVVYILWINTVMWTLHTYHASTTTTIVVTTLNILLCVAIIYTARQKQQIARFVENCIEKKAMRTVIWSFLPLSITVAYNFFLPRFVSPKNIGFFLNDFRSAWVEISVCLIYITFALAVLSLVAGISKFEKLSAKSLFEKPATVFLLLFGLTVECMAATTRAIRLPRELSHLAEVSLESLLFGMVYFIPAALITFYNKQHQWRYLLIFAAIGFTLETSVGIDADLSRGGTYYTAGFVTALILGVIGGRFLGNAIRNKVHVIA
jgi:hypothetical protein